MVSKKNALGKGLGALLENAKTDITSKAGIETNAQAGLTSRINIDNITPNPFQPRIDFEKESLLELTESCLLYTSPSPRDRQKSRMPSSA